MVEKPHSIEEGKQNATPAEISARAKRLINILNLGQTEQMAEKQGIPGAVKQVQDSHMADLFELVPMHSGVVRKVLGTFVKQGEWDSVTDQHALELANFRGRIDSLRGRNQVDPTFNGEKYRERNEQRRKLAEELEPHIAHVDRVVTLIQYEELLKDDVLKAAAKFGDNYEALEKELGGDPLVILAESRAILVSKLETEEAPIVKGQLQERITTIDKLLKRIPEAQRELDEMLADIELPIKQDSRVILLRLFDGMQEEDKIAVYLRNLITQRPQFAKFSPKQLSEQPEIRNDANFKEVFALIPGVLTELPIDILIEGQESGEEGVPDVAPYFVSLDAQLRGISFDGNTEEVRNGIPKWIDEIRADLKKNAPSMVTLTQMRLNDITTALGQTKLSALKQKELETEKKRCEDFMNIVKPILDGTATVDQISVYADYLSWQIRETLKTSVTHEGPDGTTKDIVAAHSLNADLIRLKSEALLPRMMESPDGFIKNWSLFRDNANNEIDRLQDRVNFTTKAFSLLVTKRNYGPGTRPYTRDHQRGKLEAYRPLSPELEASLSREWNTYANRTKDLVGDVEGLAIGNPGMLDFLNMFREDGSGLGDEMNVKFGEILTGYDAVITNVLWYLPKQVGLDKLLGFSDSVNQVKLQEIQQELQKMQDRIKTVRTIYAAFLSENKPVLDAIRNDIENLQILQAAVPSEELSLTRGDPIYPPENATLDMDGYINLIIEEYRAAKKKVAEAEATGTEKEKRDAERILNDCKLKLIGANLFVLGTFHELHVEDFVQAMKKLQEDLHDSLGLGVSTNHQLESLSHVGWKYLLGFELSTAPGWWLAGGRGGLRGYPGVRLLMQNRQQGIGFVLRGIFNAPFRILNGHLRAIDGLTTFGTVGRIGDGLGRLSELSALRHSLSDAERLAASRAAQLADAERLAATRAEQLASAASRISQLENEITELQRAGTLTAEELAAKEAELASLKNPPENSDFLDTEQGRLNRLAEVTPEQRLSLARELIGEVDESIDLAKAVEAVHKYRNDELMALFDKQKKALTLGDKVLQEKIQNEINMILFEKRNMLEIQFKLPHKQASMLVRGGICGHADPFKLARALENVDLTLARNFLQSVADKPLLDILEGIDEAKKMAPQLRQQRLSEIAADQNFGRAVEVSQEAANLDKASRIASHSGLAKAGKYALPVVIDTAFIMLNEQRIQAAVQSGDYSTAEALRSKRYSLVAGGVAGLGIATVGPLIVSLPLTAVLAADAIYADYLYEHVITLNHSEIKDYLQKPAGKLLYEIQHLSGSWEFADPALWFFGNTSGSDTRKFRRENALHAYLIQRLPHTRTVEDALDAEKWFESLGEREKNLQLDSASNSMEKLPRDQKNRYVEALRSEETAKKAWVLQNKIVSIVVDRETPLVFQKLNYLRYHSHRSFENITPTLLKNADMYVEILAMSEKDPSDIEFTFDGKSHVLSLSHVKKYSGTPMYWTAIEALVDNYKKFKFQKHRLEVNVLMEIDSAKANELEAEFIKDYVKHRLLSADAELHSWYDTRKANVARVEIRRKFDEKYPNLLAGMTNNENSDSYMLQEMERFESVFREELQMFYDDANCTSIGDPSFNPLKYVVKQISLPNPDNQVAVKAAEKTLARKYRVDSIENVVSDIFK